MLQRKLKGVERRFYYVEYTIVGNSYMACAYTFPIGRIPSRYDRLIDSFLRGAALCPNIKIIINPSRNHVENSVISVPAGWRVLCDAIQLKRESKIAKSIAEPVGDYVADYGGVILDKAVDVCVVPCQWWKTHV